MVARLDQILDEFASAVADTSTVPDAVPIDRIARLEKLRAATTAVQVAELVRFAQSQVAEQMAADVHPEQIGRGIAEQIGLACRISHVVAARGLNSTRRCCVSCRTATANWSPETCTNANVVQCSTCSQ
jgi:hypothetical protein